MAFVGGSSEEFICSNADSQRQRRKESRRIGWICVIYASRAPHSSPFTPFQSLLKCSFIPGCSVRHFLCADIRVLGMGRFQFHLVAFARYNFAECRMPFECVGSSISQVFAEYSHTQCTHTHTIHRTITTSLRRPNI